MLSLSQSVGYAVLALAHLDPDGKKLVLAAEIAAAGNIPKPYLSKVIAKLQAAEIIEGKRGQNGGLRLLRPAHEISVSDVAAAIDGESWKCKCLLGLPGCSQDNPCPTHEFWGEARASVEQTLKNLTIDKVRSFTETGWKMPEIPKTKPD